MDYLQQFVVSVLQKSALRNSAYPHSPPPLKAAFRDWRPHGKLWRRTPTCLAGEVRLRRSWRTVVSQELRICLSWVRPQVSSSGDPLLPMDPLCYSTARMACVHSESDTNGEPVAEEQSEALQVQTLELGRSWTGLGIVVTQKQKNVQKWRSRTFWKKKANFLQT